MSQVVLVAESVYQQFIVRFVLSVDSGYGYTKEHEWASTEEADTITVGISNYAQVWSL